MKKTASIFLAGALAVLLIPTPARADLFGGDLVFLSQLVEQGLAAARQAEQAYENVKQFASYVEHPGSWRNAVSLATTDAAAAINIASTGSDSVALARINQSLKASREAIQQSLYLSQNPTLANLASLSSLTIQQAEAMNRQDELNRHLRDMARMDQYQAEGVGELGNVSETFKGRILR